MKMIPVLHCVSIPPQHWTATNTGACALTLHRATEFMQKIMNGQDYEARFGQDCLVEILKLMLNRNSEIEV